MIRRGTNRFAVLGLAAVLASFGCGGDAAGGMTTVERAAISDSIRTRVVETYDLTKPNVVARLMSLYPDSGPVYSTSSGHVAATRAELQQQIQTFWQYVGSNMRNPKWEWTAMHIDVLAPEAAVLTATYRIPHLTPLNTPHVIAGAWTAVFAKRDDRWMVIQEHLSDLPAAAAESTKVEAHTGH